MARFVLKDGPPSPTKSEEVDLDSLRKELDAAYEVINSFRGMDPSDIFMTISALTARASQIRSHLVRKPDNRYVQNFRTKEIDPFLEECDRQFKIWSRVFSAKQLDWDISRGQV